MGQNCSGCKLASKESFQTEQFRNIAVSAAAATVFYIGWWFIIDMEAYYCKSEDVLIHKAAHLCGICGTISLIVVNVIPNSALSSDNMNSGCCCGKGMCRFWFFLGFFLGFSAVIAAVWLMIDYFSNAKDNDSKPTWPPVALFLQNLLIFVSSVIMRFGRIEITY